MTKLVTSPRNIYWRLQFLGVILHIFFRQRVLFDNWKSLFDDLVQQKWVFTERVKIYRLVDWLWRRLQTGQDIDILRLVSSLATEKWESGSYLADIRLRWGEIWQGIDVVEVQKT